MMLFVPWTPRPPQADRASLLDALARGELPALDALYRQEAAAVYRYALALGGDAAAAADATQEAFMALALRPSGFDRARGASLGAYLAGIARHHLLAHWRRAALAAGGPFEDGDAALADLPDDGPAPEALLVQRQDVQRVHLALARLPWVFREAVVLVDLQDRPYDEAAAIAGCALNTLRTRLHRGRARLAEWLRPGPGDPR
jgi:RNA polymerase sigma-70 factor, ECF subfamily